MECSEIEWQGLGMGRMSPPYWDVYLLIYLYPFILMTDATVASYSKLNCQFWYGAVLGGLS